MNHLLYEVLAFIFVGGPFFAIMTWMLATHESGKDDE